LDPLAPAIIQVNTTTSAAERSTTTIKSMMWPLKYALPRESLDLQDTSIANAIPADAVEDVTLVLVPESVVAIRTFGDAIVEPLVRKVEGQLRASLVRDGLLSPDAASTLTFAQYDAIYSMGERRSEVHIRLADGTHPW
jgi:SOUL heme-binding protein